MRVSLRQTVYILTLFIAAQAAKTLAALQQDVLAFTGNARAKMVWVRVPRTASNFTTGNYYYYNGGPQSMLMCYDTDEQTERVLDPTLTQHMTPIISRSGEYVTWCDIPNQKSYIIKWDGSDKRELLNGGNFCILAFQWDATARKEYVYATPAKNMDRYYLPYGSSVVKMEFANGTVNTATTQTLFTTEEFRWPLLVSGDGKYASLNEWPGMSVIDLGTNQRYTKKYGCWGNVAPDKSYRFFMSDESHTMLFMYASYNATTYQTITVSSKLPGIQSEWDVAGPRYSNHPRFFSVSYPLVNGIAEAGEFCIAKFNDTFSDITAIRITGTGDTNRDKTGDLWLSTGEGPNATAIAQGSFGVRQYERPAVRMTAGRITITATETIHARLLDAGGRCITESAVRHCANIDTRRIGTGSYILWVSVDGRDMMQTVMVK